MNDQVRPRSSSLPFPPPSPSSHSPPCAHLNPDLACYSTQWSIHIAAQMNSSFDWFNDSIRYLAQSCSLYGVGLNEV